MATEVWFRNPKDYIHELAECGVKRFIWDQGFLIKRRIDPNTFMELHMGLDRPWEMLVVGETGVYHLDHDHRMRNPKAVYPYWNFDTQSIDDLEAMMADQMYALKRRKGLRYRDGQDHMLLLVNLPAASQRDFYLQVAQLQKAYPDCRLHLRGVVAYNVLFGMGFSSCDFNPRHSAATGRIWLPMGKAMDVAELELREYKYWVELMGSKLKDLDEPRERCIFNIQSLLWAGKYFDDHEVRFKLGERIRVDEDGYVRQGKHYRRIKIKQVKPQPQDKYLCNVCSLQDSCLHYRQGAVCVVPDSEPVQLAQFFKSRNSDQIIEGMMMVMQIEAERVKDARQAETDKERIDPEVTRMLNGIFNHGEKLAKLVDPSLRAGTPAIETKPAMTIGAGGTPQEIAGKVLEFLVAQGVPRHAITPEFIMAIIEAPGDDLRQKAIEAGAALKVE